VQAASGLMSITGDQEPMKVGVAVVDVLTGLHACVAILAALHERDLSGVGQHVQVNLLSSALSALVNQASSVLGAGIVPGLLGNAHPSIAPYEVYTTADRPLVIAVGNNQQFRSLCTVLGHPEWAADPRFDSNPVRVAHRDALRELLTSVLRQGSAEQWHESLTRAGVPCGPINTVAQGLDLARTLDLAPQSPPADPTDPVAHVAPPFRLSRTPATYRTRPPQLGEDTARIVDRLGLDG
jgi:crotonobetainyl-CoA:carnitine CoA-transferase CaiB-like acyl-CoA transferase